MQVEVTAAFKGFDLGDKTSPVSIYVAEYNNRERLRKIGFVEDLANLDALTGEYLVAISKIISKLEDDERKKNER